jgi:selenocysteine-specific elongation factor
VRTVATAGHVDHGKSALILALTGTDPDRLAEEKARGLTIDLGFAFTTLPSGTEVGFVDVPGHVRFIKNMLAGVGAVEVALFVVAASEGWMPQSEEHLRILQLLGVQAGMVAITKADAVDAETLVVAQLEVEERFASSPLAHAPVVVCDSISQRGLDEVRATLDAVLATAPPPRDVGRPRLWVDRVFAARGAGTVVTGTLTGGALAVDEDVQAGAHRARIRAVESAGRRLDHVGPGARVALNLAGVEHRDLRRGDAVVRPGQWATPTVVDVAMTPLMADETTRRRRLHAAVGSGEHRASYRPLDPAGRHGRLRLEVALPLAPGDRLVLRDLGRRRTVAGAEVVDVLPARRSKDAPARLALPLGERLLAASPWLTPDGMARAGGLSPAETETLADNLVARGLASRRARWLVETKALAALRREAHQRVQERHRAHPQERGLDLAGLAAVLQVTPPQLRAALADDPDLVVDRGTVRDRSHAGSAAASPAGQRILAAFEAAPFAPPSPSEAGDPALVRALVREGALVDVDGVVLAAGALDAARQTVVDALGRRGRLTVADIRDLLGSTRKFVVPICGWLDRQGVTRRRGDERIPGPASGLAR